MQARALSGLQQPQWAWEGVTVVYLYRRTCVYRTQLLQAPTAAALVQAGALRGLQQPQWAWEL
jgi:hypothetical protein